MHMRFAAWQCLACGTAFLKQSVAAAAVCLLLLPSNLQCVDSIPDKLLPVMLCWFCFHPLAGPFGWGGMLFVGTAVASWLAPVMTNTITTYATSKVRTACNSYKLIAAACLN